MIALAVVAWIAFTLGLFVAALLSIEDRKIHLGYDRSEVGFPNYHPNEEA